MKTQLLLAAASALALTACGQQAAEPAAAPEPAPPPITQVQVTPADFVQGAANNAAFAAQASELAGTRAENAQVKVVAEQVSDANAAMSQELATLAPTLQLAAPTPTLSPSQSAAIENLTAAQGEAFDDAYLDQQVAAHETTIRLFQDFIASAADGPLKAWAEATLPKLQQQLAGVQALEDAT